MVTTGGKVAAVCALVVIAGCTTTKSSVTRATPTLGPSPSSSAAARPPAGNSFSGDLVPRIAGQGSRTLPTVRLQDDVELYLQCTRGTATVTYAPAGRSTCPPSGVPLIVRVSADPYPATVTFAVVAEDGAGWVLAVDSHPVTIEGTNGTAVLSTQVRAACEHVLRAVTAQEEHDWATVTAELAAAWKPGHLAGDREFAESVPSPGAIEPGDTQTLNEQTDALARRCRLSMGAE